MQARKEYKELDRFLEAIQGRAFRMALASLQHRDDALDVVQESMIKLVEKYRDKPASEWAPLFYRILYTRIKDVQRRRTRGGKIFAQWLSRDAGSAAADDAQPDPIAQAPDTSNPDPQRFGDDKKFGVALQEALQALPERQRQAFMLRAWEGMDVAQTAHAMGCSQGSVKTHYSRARAFLQQALGEFAGPELSPGHR